MYESLKTTLHSWNDRTTERNKLQHLYIALALVLLIAAGLVGLLNQEAGQQILAAAIAAAVIFLVNAVMWALLQSFVLLRIHEKPQDTRTQTKSSPAKSTPAKRTVRK